MNNKEMVFQCFLLFIRLFTFPEFACVSVFIWKQSNVNYPVFMECQVILVLKLFDKIKAILNLL